MFPIMTEAQIKAADEATLRERARELGRAIALLQVLRDTQQTALNYLGHIAKTLVNIEEYLKPKLKPKRKRRASHAKRTTKKG